jgi:hypothetical protein
MHEELETVVAAALSVPREAITLLPLTSELSSPFSRSSSPIQTRSHAARTGFVRQGGYDVRPLRRRSFAAAAVAPSPAGPIHVEPTGTDSPLCGAVSVPCATLTFAVAKANLIPPLSAVVNLLLGPGFYGSTSCGAEAIRPLNVTGAGSSTTVIVCSHSKRLLSANDSIALSGLHVSGGFVNASGVVSQGSPGGGAVAVMWSTNVPDRMAVFEDLSLSNNTVLAVIDAPSNGSQVIVGGGGIFVSGGGNGSWVEVHNCSFFDNYVSGSGNAMLCGGAVCIVLGASVLGDESPLWPLSSVGVSVTDVRAVGNTVRLTPGNVNVSGKGQPVPCLTHEVRPSVASLFLRKVYAHCVCDLFCAGGHGGGLFISATNNFGVYGASVGVVGLNVTSNSAGVFVSSLASI